MAHAEAQGECQDAAPNDHHGSSTEAAAKSASDEHKQKEEAAQMIQKHYRGYRERRQLQGMGLDATTRWVEVWLSELSPLSVGWLYYPAIPLTLAGRQRGSVSLSTALYSALILNGQKRNGEIPHVRDRAPSDPVKIP